MREEKLYSERARFLARQLAEKAAANLRRSGYTVTFHEDTGRYTIVKPKRDTEAAKHE